MRYAQRDNRVIMLDDKGAVIARISMKDILRTRYDYVLSADGMDLVYESIMLIAVGVTINYHPDRDTWEVVE